MQAGRCDNHRFGLTTYLVHGHASEMFQHDRCFLRYIVGMQRFIIDDSLHACSRIQFRIVCNRLCYLIIHLIGHVVLKHIQDKPLLNGLPHGINMERMIFAIIISPSEHL